jgi:hypothetical protein
VRSFPYLGAKSSRVVLASIALVTSVLFEAFFLKQWSDMRGMPGPYGAFAAIFGASAVLSLVWLIHSRLLSKRTIEIGEGRYAEVGWPATRSLDLAQLGPEHVRFEKTNLVVEAYKLPGSWKSSITTAWSDDHFVAFVAELRAAARPAMPSAKIDELFVQLDAMIASQEKFEKLQKVSTLAGAVTGNAASIGRLIAEASGRKKVSELLREQVAKLRSDLVEADALQQPAKKVVKTSKTAPAKTAKKPAAR